MGVGTANRNPAMRGRSWVYFAQIGDGGPVKIGRTRALHRRIGALAAMHAEPIVLLGTIPETDVSERVLHNEFSRHRIKGEWFAPHPEILKLADAGKKLYADGYRAIFDDDADTDALIEIMAFRVLNRVRS